MTQLKDVLHFYLGCKAQVRKNQDRKFFIGNICEVTKESNHGDWVEIKFKDGVEVTYNDSEPRFSNFHSYFIDEDDIQPILRPLASMTEEEADQLQDHMWGGFQDAWEPLPELLKMFMEPWDSEYRPAFPVYVKAINWLRSKGFDCDDLVEKGVALDSTTLKEEGGGE